MTEQHAVVIAGGGPTGLMLAGELALARVDVAVVEKRATQALESARAGGLHARTLEVLDQRGIVERFLAQGQRAQVASLGGITLDITDLPTRHNYGLALFQQRIEQTLADWVAELGVPTYRACEVTGFAQDDDGVTVDLSDGNALRAQYLVGCDGGRSVVRRTAGIDFVGWEASISWLIAECEMSEEPAWGVRRTAQGINAIGKLDEGKRARVVLAEPRVMQGEAPTMEDLRAALAAVFGSDFGAHRVTYLSRFSDAARQASTYRAGRVLLAGDAAHVHSPQGGQGLNLGVQDAVNLGWKLALVTKGACAERLLDSYTAERHPVGARVLKSTLAQAALHRGDDRTDALRETLTGLLTMDGPRRKYGAQLSSLDLQYDLGPGHPLLGRRMPDLDVLIEGEPRRVFSMLHEARGALLVFANPQGFDAAPWAGRVQRFEAQYTGPWELPVVGAVAAPAAVLVRPDGHVAWVGDGTDAGLREALERWFGAPANG